MLGRYCMGIHCSISLRLRQCNILISSHKNYKSTVEDNNWLYMVMLLPMVLYHNFHNYTGKWEALISHEDETD